MANNIFPIPLYRAHNQADPVSKRDAQPQSRQTPKENFSFAKWTVVSGDAELKSATANPTTFTMPAANVEIKAEFAAVPNQITAFNKTGSRKHLAVSSAPCHIIRFRPALSMHQPVYVKSDYLLRPQHFLYFLPLPHGHGSFG